MRISVRVLAVMVLFVGMTAFADDAAKSRDGAKRSDASSASATAPATPVTVDADAEPQPAPSFLVSRPASAQFSSSFRGENTRAVEGLAGYSSARFSTNGAAGYSGETKPAKVEVFTGYSWMNSNNTISGVTLGVPTTVKLQDARSGFLVDFSYFFNKWAGVTVDTGAHFGDTYDADEVFAGPTVRFPAEHVQLFIHGLGGWHRLSPTNAAQNDGTGFVVGGGMDLKVARHLSIRLFQADYLWSSHSFGAGNPSTINGSRLAAGLVFLGGVGEELKLPASATCSVDTPEVWAGEPVKVSVAPRNFDPKHTLKYEWATNGGKVQGQGNTVTIDTTDVAEGQSYAASVHVTDPKSKNAVASCQSTFATKKRLPPTITCTANPTSLLAGGAVAIHCVVGSPQGGPVTVTQKADRANIGGQGTDLTVNTQGFEPGTVTVQSTVTDDHQLSASTSTSFTVQVPPPPPPKPQPTAIELRLALHSIYFVTAQPTPANPNGGLLASQQKTLIPVAADFKVYLESHPDARLILEGHADPRGSVPYNQALSERRVERTKRFLVEHGVPAANIEVKGYGHQKNLTDAEVRQAVNANPDLTPGERQRILRNERTIILASNRRVDITLSTTGQTSVRQFPFSAEDALTLIGGREKPKPAAKPAPRRARPAPGKARPAPKKQQ